MADKKLTAKEQMAENNKRMQAKREAASAPRKASASKEVVKPSSAKESMAATSKRMAERRASKNETEVRSVPKIAASIAAGADKRKSDAKATQTAAVDKMFSPTKTPTMSSAKASDKPAVRTSPASGPANTQRSPVPTPSASSPAKSKVNPLGRKLDKNGAPIIGKAELEKSGLSLGAFLNKERKLTSRVKPLQELEEINVLTGKKIMAKGGLTKKKK